MTRAASLRSLTSSSLGVHDGLVQNADDATALISLGLAVTSPQSIKIKGETIKCLQVSTIFCRLGCTPMIQDSLGGIEAVKLTCVRSLGCFMSRGCPPPTIR